MPALRRASSFEKACDASNPRGRIGSLESSSLHGAIPDLIALAGADN